MLTFYAHSPEERLSLWRSFRESIKDSPQEMKLQKVATFFARTPIGARSLDYYTPSTWPIPWEILYHGSYCTNSISLLIYYSLVLFPEFNDNAEIWLINDGENDYLLPVVDDQYILNYELGVINKYADIKDRIKILEVFDDSQIKQLT